MRRLALRLDWLLLFLVLTEREQFDRRARGLVTIEEELFWILTVFLLDKYILLKYLITLLLIRRGNFEKFTLQFMIS